MGLIKSNQAPESLAAFSLTDIERHAKLIVVRAQQQAEQILAAARDEAEMLKAEAKSQGAAEGMREGFEKGLEQGGEEGKEQALGEHRDRLVQAFQSLSQAITAFDADRAELESQALAEVVELAVAIARRVTKRQGLIDPAVLVDNLQGAMRLVISASDLRIAINPAQRKALDAALPQLRLNWPALKHVQIVEDPTVGAGGCRLFTTQGEIDADLNGQLDRIAAELLPTA